MVKYLTLSLHFAKKIPLASSGTKVTVQNIFKCPNGIGTGYCLYNIGYTPEGVLRFSSNSMPTVARTRLKNYGDKRLTVLHIDTFEISIWSTTS